jgi:DNA-binding beta-propeller fold protein YncE
LRLESNQPPPPPPAGQPPVECEPANLPRYCLLPVPGNFDRPAGAYFSPDGGTAFVLNSGPENGGSAASISTIPTAAITTTNYPTAPITSPVTGNVPIPGGATVAISDGTTLYVAGSQRQPDGLFAGRLTLVDIASQTVKGTSFNISDGNHGVMRFADDNTLWIGSTLCATGEANKGLPQPTHGCLTLFNRSSNAVLIEPYLGDLTGIADIVGFHKIYVAEGGQVYRYNTPDGSRPDVPTILVGGTAYDVAYMDAASNTQD